MRAQPQQDPVDDPLAVAEEEIDAVLCEAILASMANPLDGATLHSWQGAK